MKQVRIGVFGGGRGISMVEFCTKYSEAKLVAICDKSNEVMENVKEFIRKANEKNEIKTEVTYYSDFNAFIKHDMDAVILANYATDLHHFSDDGMYCRNVRSRDCKKGSKVFGKGGASVGNYAGLCAECRYQLGFALGQG